MNKSVLIISALFMLSFAFSNCKQEESMEEWGEKVSEQMCGKMEECSGEMLKSVPESMRAQIKARMPSKETCMQKSRESRQEQIKDGKEINLSADEVQVFKSCMAEMTSASCDSLMKGQFFKTGPCKEMQAISQRKTSQQ